MNFEEAFINDDDNSIIYETTPSGGYINRVAKIYNGANRDKLVKLFLNSEKMLEILKRLDYFQTTHLKDNIIFNEILNDSSDVIREIEQ